ncbi:MAG: hypothetical protein IKH54_07505 [Bacilli bacterium]|nr:hypothetical protein [Bacilli bacterium]
MEDFIYYNELYDLYSSLLTDKQRQYFEDYYFHNLSFSEMGENYNVSRNAIFKQLKITKEKLDEFESNLKLLQKKNKLVTIIEKIDNQKIKKELEELI